jgi:hypothetical protein
MWNATPFFGCLTAIEIRIGVSLHNHIGLPQPAASTRDIEVVSRFACFGLCCDIGVYGERAYELVQAATSLGMTGIGVMQSGPLVWRYIHLDNAVSRPFAPRPMIWSYARQGD